MSITHFSFVMSSICPGRVLAENILWLACASILACFKFSLAQDENGDDINVDYAKISEPGVIM